MISLAFFNYYFHPRGMRITSALVIVTLATGMFSACSVGPIYQKPLYSAATVWQAPIPVTTEAEALTNLNNFWQQFDDPLVAELINSAQISSPTLEQALARIGQARANVGATDARSWPSLDTNLRANRGNTVLSNNAGSSAPVATVSSLTLDAAWELDLFGANRSARTAAQARLAARTAQWHDARISLAAEVASTLIAWRTCNALVALSRQDLLSRQQTAALTALKVKAGFTAPADSALIDASTADARQRLTSQQAECDVNVKALVALTSLPEPDLRKHLYSSDRLPAPRQIKVTTVPAQTLSQRPDIAASERELAATSSEINVAEANRYPRISLTGSIGIAGLRIASAGSDSNTWSFGPALNLPLFDAGQRRANVDAAQARYDEALASYRQRTISAVREVEEALVRLEATTQRLQDATTAAREYERFFKASEDRQKAGTASLLELEEARRITLTAQQGLINLHREQRVAWISLYKALGGGWQADTDAPQTKVNNPTLARP